MFSKFRQLVFDGFCFAVGSRTAPPLKRYVGKDVFRHLHLGMWHLPVVYSKWLKSHEEPHVTLCMLLCFCSHLSICECVILAQSLPRVLCMVLGPRLLQSTVCLPLHSLIEQFQLEYNEICIVWCAPATTSCQGMRRSSTLADVGRRSETCGDYVTLEGCAVCERMWKYMQDYVVSR